MRDQKQVEDLTGKLGYCSLGRLGYITSYGVLYDGTPAWLGVGLDGKGLWASRNPTIAFENMASYESYLKDDVSHTHRNKLTEREAYLLNALSSLISIINAWNRKDDELHSLDYNMGHFDAGRDIINIINTSIRAFINNIDGQ